MTPNRLLFNISVSPKMIELSGTTIYNINNEEYSNKRLFIGAKNYGQIIILHGDSFGVTNLEIVS